MPEKCCSNIAAKHILKLVAAVLPQSMLRQYCGNIRFRMLIRFAAILPERICGNITATHFQLFCSTKKSWLTVLASILAMQQYRLIYIVTTAYRVQNTVMYIQYKKRGIFNYHITILFFNKLQKGSHWMKYKKFKCMFWH